MAEQVSQATWEENTKHATEKPLLAHDLIIWAKWN